MGGIVLNSEFLRDLCKHMIDIIHNRQHAQQLVLNFDSMTEVGVKKDVFVFVCDEETKDAICTVLDYLYGPGEHDATPE